MHAALADAGVVSAGTLDDECVSASRQRRRLDLRVGRARMAEADVVADRAVEQKAVLEDDADLRAPRALLTVPEIDVVHLDRARRGFLQPEQETQQRAL